MSLWMLTRVVDNDWVVIQSQGSDYDVHQGDVFSWVDSYCCRMVQGDGPMVSANSSLDAVYSQTPIHQALQINGYVGIPVYESSGNFFGTLCALQPEPMSAEQEQKIQQNFKQIELLSMLLVSIYHQERLLMEQKAHTEHYQCLAQFDELTKLYNRTGWKCRREALQKAMSEFALSVTLVVFDLNNLKQINDSIGHHAGDNLICAFASTLESYACREDVLVRLGGDEFLWCLVDLEEAKAHKKIIDFVDHAKQQRLAFAWGAAYCLPNVAIEHALMQADQRMYEDKARSKQGSIAS